MSCGHRPIGLIAALALVAARGAAQTTAIVGATVIDGRGGPPVAGATILVAHGKIRAVGPSAAVPVPDGARTIAAAGKYVIPGLMDANVHLVFGISIEYLARYETRLEAVIEEAAQVALANGLTTVFDSWGPLEPLVNVRDRIGRGEIPGARLFVAGNIIGLTGPFGRDFNPDGESRASPGFARRINALWEQGTGPELMWLTPDSLALAIRAYAARPRDFLKYAVSGHTLPEMLMFSPEQQRTIIDESRRVGKPIQTHTTSVESLRQAILAGVDLMQHCSITGMVPIPEATIRLMIERRVWCAVQPKGKRDLAAQAAAAGGFPPRLHYADLVRIADLNERRLIQAGAPLVLATDSGIMDPDEWAATPAALKEENATELGPAHFRWFAAMAEKGMKPMEAILAATRNVAAAYQKLAEIGTLEPGKRADLLILDADPLADLANIRKIRTIMKDGVEIDRSRLPVHPVLTAARAPQ
jgi:imidazolonepropionase-like amidohydrolase